MLAIRATQMFDGLQLMQRPMILVDRDRIAAVDCTGVAPPDGCQVIDLGDATLLPGLIDTHAHLVFDASTDPAGHLQAATDQALLAGARRAARRALDAGITCIRDMGDRSYLTLQLRDENAAQPALGPDIVPSGPPITVPGGHCWFLGGATTGDGITAAVREHVRDGAAVIKIMATGGHMTSGPNPQALAASQFSPDELRAAADEAHRHGLPITAHAHGRDGIVAAHQAGFDGVEHASFLTSSGPRPDPEVIDDLAASGTFISTCIPGTVPGVPLPPIIAAMAEPARTLMRALADGGTRIVIGPDAGIGPHKPHHVLPHAIADMAQFLGNAGALTAATRQAAGACNLTGRKGRIASGHDADILAVDGNPLSDIAAICRPVAIFHRGHLVPPHDQHARESTPSTSIPPTAS
jgi:imidazolonepropionase-like amidohydrolase